jgi:serine protease Do
MNSRLRFPILIAVSVLVAGLAGGLSARLFSPRLVVIERSPAGAIIDVLDAGADLSVDRENAIVRAARSVSPSVVSITVVSVQTVRRSGSPFGRDDFFDRFFSEFFPQREYNRQVQGIGSGVIFHEDGYVLSNNHVVEGATEITITLPDGTEYPGVVVGTDAATDISVLRIDGEGPFPAAALGDSDDLIIGEWAIAIGNPFGFLLEDPSPTVTAGVISAVRRDIKTERGDVRFFRDMIQTDASINQGNSGGPLVNARGEVIGINTFIFSTSQGSEGVGFAIPINRARRVAADLIAHGEVRKVWIGVQVQPMNALFAEGLDLPPGTEGVLVSAVDESSPAAEAGIQRGDIIIRVGERDITSSGSFQEVYYELSPGNTVPFTIIRKKKQMVVNVQVEELPTSVLDVEPGKFGIGVADITSELAGQLGLRTTTGVVIATVADRSVASRQGLAVGDVIRRVNDVDVTRVREYETAVRAIKPEARVSLLVERGGELYVLSFTWRGDQ